MNFEIGFRFTSRKLAVEIDAKFANEPHRIQLGAAVKAALSEGANLTDANLAGANLTDANLTDANLAGANLTDAYLTGANLTGANLTGANLTGAYLAGAYLTGANLTGANLTGAYLTDANLTDANLTGAYLTGANLTGAKGIARERCIDLLMLLDQPGAIRAYKLVGRDMRSPIHDTKITYAIGATYEEPDANTSVTESCGVGLHVATLPWCLKNYSEGHRVLLVEFTAADIACIPTGTDGKFRVCKFTVVGEKDISALVAKPEKAKEAA